MKTSLKQYHNKNEEVDLLQILKILWMEKLVIIFLMILFFFGGLYFHSIQNDRLEVNFEISTSSENSSFLKFIHLNDILSLISLTSKDYTKLNINNSAESLNDIYKISADKILNKFVFHFKKKDILIDLLSNQYSQIQNDNNNDLEKTMSIKSKKFKITRQDENTYKIFFTWDNLDQVNALSDAIVENIFLKVKEDIINDLNLILEFNKVKYDIELENATKDIELLLLKENDKIKSQLLFLKEQLSIAEKLSINENALYGSSFTSIIALTSQNIPYYLIGSEAIKEEIEILKNRDANERVYFSDEFIERSNDIRKLKNNFKNIEKLEEGIISISNQNYDDLLNYNFGFANIKNRKIGLINIIALSLLLGFSLSASFIFSKRFIKYSLK